MGIGLVPGERRNSLFFGLSVRDNIILPHLGRLSQSWRINRRGLDPIVVSLVESLDIRPRDAGVPVGQLSGGNQQKVIFARWLMGEIFVLLLDEPTHGIDVGAKARIHRLMREFAKKGGGIMFASSEVSEVAAISDLVLTMRNGKIMTRLSRQDAHYGETAVRQELAGAGRS